MKFSDYTKKNLNETSLSRIYRHITKEDIDSWSIQTSFLDGYSTKENEERYKKLQHDIRSMGYGFIRMKGVGQEQDETGEITEVTEKSMFIPKINLKLANRLAEKYGQTAFIYSGPEVDDKIALVYTDSGKKEYIGRFHPGKIARFYSKIKGRKTFVFEEILSYSWFEGLAKQIKAKKKTI